MTPLLPPLWSTYLTSRSPSALASLAALYSDLVDVVVRSKYPTLSRDPGAFLNIHDLVTVGKIALMKAIPDFDPTRGVRPESFLSSRIRHAIMEEMRESDHLSRTDRRVMRRLEAAAAAGLGEDEAGIPAAKVKQVRETDRRMRPMPMSEVKEFDPGEAVETGTILDALKRVCSGWPERHVKAIVLFQLERFSLREVHAVLTQRRGRSLHAPPWVRRVKREAMEMLKAALASRESPSVVV